MNIAPSKDGVDRATLRLQPTGAAWCVLVASLQSVPALRVNPPQHGVSPAAPIDAHPPCGAQG